MATTTNYAWETPDDTDLVKDGAAAIRTLGSSIDTTTKALNPSTTLGDIEYRSSTANTNTRLGIGTTGQVLTVSGGVPAWTTVASSSTYSGVSVYRSSAQSIPHDTNTLVTWDAEFFDTNAYHSTSTNTSRLTVPSGKAGKYLIQATITLAQSATGIRKLSFYKNGSLFSIPFLIPATGDPFNATGVSIANLAEGDYIECYFEQSSGSAKDLSGTTTASSFSLNLLGA